MRRRRWEVIFFPYPYWHFHILKRYGKYKHFLTETWLGPICIRVWSDPKAAHTKPFRKAHILF